MALLAICLGFPGFAQRLPSVTVLAQSSRGGYEVFLVEDELGNRATVLAEKPITAERARPLLQQWLTLRNLRDVEVAETRIVLSDSLTQIVLIPRRYLYEDVDLAAFLPAGLQFYANEALYYDFRMLVGHYFLRMRGEYTSEEQLSRTLNAAAKTPVAYLRQETTAYLNDRFSAIEDDIAKLQKLSARNEARLESLREEGKSVVADMQGRQDTLEQQTNSLFDGQSAVAARQEQILDDQQSLAVRVGDLETAQQTAATDIASLKGLYATLKSAVDSSEVGLEQELRQLQSDYGDLVTDFATLRTAVLVLNNRRGAQVDTTALGRLLEAKRANPLLTRDEAKDLARQENLGLSSREVELIYAIFFGEFE
jgi:hypothetical protein